MKMCNNGKCGLTRQGMDRHPEHENEVDDEEIWDSNTIGFDDVIIHQTNERLNQEFANLSSLETKAGILIAAVAAIVTILVSGSVLSSIGNHLTLNFYGIIFGLIGALFFGLSFAIPLMIIIPRNKLELLDPRTMNNQLYSSSLPEVKRQIRYNLIKSFEEIEKIRDKEIKAIKISFVFLGLGALCFIIIFLMSKL